MKKTIAALVLVGLFGFSGTWAEAKTSNVKANAKAKVAVEAVVTPQAATSTSSTAPCAKAAWGHLFAKGWLKKNVRPAVPACAMPEGIMKKLGLTPPAPTSTPPADVTAPVISGVSSTAATSSLVIRWNANEASTGKVYLSTVSPVSFGSSTVAIDNTMSTVHAVTVNGLAANTTYFFVIESRDAAGNVSTSSQQSATTLVWDITPPVISSTAVSGISSTSAAISWNTNEPATGKLTYGTSSSLTGGSMVMNSILAGSQAVNLSGLQASTTYYFAIEAKDASGNAATSSVQSFITLQ
jgi:hypothetical protein